MLYFNKLHRLFIVYVVKFHCSYENVEVIYEKTSQAFAIISNDNAVNPHFLR